MREHNNKRRIIFISLIAFILIILVLFSKYREYSYNKSVDEALKPLTLKDVLPYSNYSVGELVYCTIISDPPDISYPQIPYPDREAVNNALEDMNLKIEVE